MPTPWAPSSYFFDAGRMNRSGSIRVRKPWWSNNYTSYGVYDYHQTTSQYRWPGQWSYWVWRVGEGGPFRCSCLDYRTRGYNWFACKHVLAVLGGK